MDTNRTGDFKRKILPLIQVPLYSNALYLIIKSGVTSFLGFFFWIVVARFYTQAVVGFSSAVLSAINLLTIISLVGLNTLLVRRLPGTGEPSRLINTCLTISGGISVLVAVIFIAGIDFWSPAIVFISEHIIFAVAFVSFTLLSTLAALIDTSFVALRRAGFTLYRDTIFSLLKIPLPILFLPFLLTFGIVSSWGIALCISLLISFFIFLPRIQSGYRPIPGLKLHLIRDLGHYTTGNYLANLFTAAPGFILPLMVVNSLGAEINAFFYIPWTIAGAIFSIPIAISSSLFAESSHFEEQMRENVIRSVKFSLALLIPAVILLVLAGKWVLLAFGESYSANGLLLLQVMAISSLPLSINSIYTSVLRVTYRTKELVAFRGLMSAGALLASYLAMSVIGIIGVGYGWLGIQTLATIYIMLFRRQAITNIKESDSSRSEN